MQLVQLRADVSAEKAKHVAVDTQALESLKADKSKLEERLVAADVSYKKLYHEAQQAVDKEQKQIWAEKLLVQDANKQWDDEKKQRKQLTQQIESEREAAKVESEKGEAAKAELESSVAKFELRIKTYESIIEGLVDFTPEKDRARIQAIIFEKTGLGTAPAPQDAAPVDGEKAEEK